MKVRTKAFLQTIGGVTAGAGIVLALDYISPKFGILVFLSGILLCMIYGMYKARVAMLELEQNRIVDEIKK